MTKRILGSVNNHKTLFQLGLLFKKKETINNSAKGLPYNLRNVCKRNFSKWFIQKIQSRINQTVS
jgi:hypothetical protein